MNRSFTTANQQSNAEPHALTSASTRAVDEVPQSVTDPLQETDGLTFPSVDNGIDLSAVPARSEQHQHTHGNCSAKEGGHCDCPNCTKARTEGRETSVGDRGPAGKMSTEQSPANETRPNTVHETSTRQSAVSETLPGKSVGSETLPGQPAVSETSSRKSVVGETSSQESAVSEMPSRENAVSETSSRESAVSETSSRQRTTDETPAQQSVADKDTTRQSVVDTNSPDKDKDVSDETPIGQQLGDSSMQESEVGEERQGSSAEQSSPKLIAEDTVANLEDGQMTKTQFLQQLRVEIANTIEPVLTRVGQTTDKCPYLNYWLNFYQGRDARDIERTVRKYAPDSIHARTAGEYISIVAQRALKAAEIWAKTGKITGIPEGVSVDIPGQPPVEAGNKKGVNANMVQAKAKSGGARRGEDPVAMQAELGEGQPLAADVRGRMESAFGVNFSHVRTHTDTRAGELSNSVNARAFTVGNHVAFGSGEYRPGTALGDALIAHELAHTIQQGNAHRPDQNAEVGSGGYEALEQDADTAAAGVMASLWKGGKGGLMNHLAQTIMPRMTSGLRLQRCSNSSSSSSSGGGASTAVTITATPWTPSAAVATGFGLSGTAATAGPNKLPNGQYTEFISWSTTGRNGFIVQEITNTYSATPCPPNTTANAAFPTPHYWEAWSVDGSGNVGPAIYDAWVRPARPTYSGTWGMSSRVFWVTSLDTAAGFAANGVTDAGGLQATTTAPTNLGTALLTRSASGTWDCAGTHT